MKRILSTIAALICLNANAQNLQWANATGGINSEYGFAVAIDNSGNSFTTGYFKGTVDFDPGSATFNLTAASTTWDIFISKTDAAGNFVWAKKIGNGTGNESSSGIAIDAAGDVYTTGHFYGTVDFDPGAGTTNLISAGGADVYVVKLNSSGNFVWAKSFGGGVTDYSLTVTTDAQNNVYTSGYFTGPSDFDPGAGVFNLSGTYSVFISKLDANGNFVWAKNIIGNSTNEPRSVSLDGAGNVYVAGRAGDGFPTTTGVLQPTFAGDLVPNTLYGKQDGFVT
ncbi:MAG: hypothetical protein IAF38_05485, partial [Bacteroidia bacterium]|nr:hypothetical protein [Bacteroidia bacterium]